MLPLLLTQADSCDNLLHKGNKRNSSSKDVRRFTLREDERLDGIEIKEPALRQQRREKAVKAR